MTAQDDGKRYKTCGAKKRQGPGTCTRPSGWGTDHPGYGRCKLHGGKSPNGDAHARREQAETAVATYGLAREVEPHVALLEELHRTAGHVSWLSMLIADLEQPDLTEQVGGVGNALPSTEPTVWLRLYQQERRHFASVAKTCLDAGIAERQIRLAEQQGQLIAGVIIGVLRDLEIDPTTDAVRSVVRRRLTTATDVAELEGVAAA